MFAVPGWNLAAKALVAEQAKPVKDKPSDGSSAVPTRVDQSRKSRKRKRTHEASTQGLPAARFQDHETSAKVVKEQSSLDISVPKAEKKPFDRNRKQRSRNQRPSNSQKITGANAEPVGPIGNRKVAKQKPTQPQPEDNTRGEAIESSSKPTSPKPVNGHNGHTTLPLPPIPPAAAKLTPLQAKMRAKLTSARFRHLNETLYTTSSSDALKLFQDSPDLFSEYHTGFAQQVKDSWPQNPVDTYIKSIKDRGILATPVGSQQPLPRRKPGPCIIADLGCGDAPLARGLQKTVKRLNLKLNNFDLHASNDLVTVADISALPLRDGEVDIAIFCLSLMGTNWLSFVEEAWRILRGDGKGELWVAEVKSRFGRVSARSAPGRVVENSVGKRRKPQMSRKNQTTDAEMNDSHAFVEDEESLQEQPSKDDTDLQPFIDSFERRGLQLKTGSIDKTNKMFVSMIFMKAGVPKVGKWKGMKWNGKEYQRMEEQRRGQRPAFHSGRQSMLDETEIDEKEEAKLLKPCVYKLR